MSRFFTFFCLFFIAVFSSFTETQAKNSTDFTVKQYNKASAYYNNLSFNKGEINRDRWVKGVQSFQKIYHTDPSHEKAPLSLYQLARMYGDMHTIFKTSHDLVDEIGYYEDLAMIFPQHRLADDALFALGQIALKQNNDPKQAETLFARIVAVYPEGDKASAAALQLREIKNRNEKAFFVPVLKKPENLPEKTKTPLPKNTVEDFKTGPMAHLSQPVRFWSTQNYTRVVIEVSQPVHYTENFLKASGDLPRRLYVDLYNCRIAPTFQNPIPIRDGLLKRVRGAQFDKETVRVVLDTESVDQHKIFTLQDPFRVVIDVTGNKPKKRESLPTLAEQFGLGVQTIVIDPGHGGKDPGAVSSRGLQEKDVVLKVAKKVGAILEKETAYKVILTRKNDTYIPLEERTAIANTRDADLFVSIHANSAPNKEASGVETYFLSLATSREEMRAAARENASSQSQLSDLQTILKDLMQNSKIEESAKLAGSVQGQLVKGLNGSYSVNNHGVKKAPFIVLIGAQMPAILTEIAFLSNREEERRLRDDLYLEAIARHIVGGITHYVSNLNSTL